MSTNQYPPLAVVGGVGVEPVAMINDAEIPKPQKPLTDAEKPVWNYICRALKAHGLIHKTDALVLHVIVSTFARWVAAEAQVDALVAEKGTYVVTTRNGYEQPHQMFFVARNLKRDLLQWLPEAALTIPSFQKAKKLLDGDGDRQPDMFSDLGGFVASKPRLVSSQ